MLINVLNKVGAKAERVKQIDLQFCSFLVFLVACNLNVNMWFRV